FGAAIVRERESRRRGVSDPQLGRRGVSGLERDTAVEQHNRLVVAIESGHDPADVGCRCGGVHQNECDDQADYLAGHYVLLFYAPKPFRRLEPGASPLAADEQECGLFPDPSCPQRAITLSRKDWHSYAKRAVL